ncbi:DUF3102 domain-containing protein [Paenibacillus sp. VCA1]|uniref:DUF3102 domain-containing protein n=1 Tax=Paenibacillus sp. VCA1 TaxID=3039148 RepID=UPI002871DE0C|nr:DUF3102 domain-containing protein [Paenibacillus sp. VCA1]MDR9857851.1 DUF3102 domain-containing protein [Paenibacillus sp. VCA1]
MTTQMTIQRTADVIAAEIRSIDQQARQYVLQSAIDIGTRLKEAKELVPHGEWGTWLKNNVNYSQSTAINFMKVSEEYANSQALANLSYTQAVQLLSIPAEEREQFVQENNVTELSTRELKEVIKEKKALEKQLQKANEQAEYERLEREKLERSLSEMQQQNAMNYELAERYKAEIEAATASGNDEQAAKLQEELNKAQASLVDSNKKIKELEKQLKAKPIDIPAKEIIEKVPEAVEKELEQLREKVKRSDNKALAKFAVYFEAVTNNFSNLLSVLHEIKTNVPEEYEKYRNAAAGLLDRMGEKVK